MRHFPSRKNLPRLVTSIFRMKPSFLIIGYPKCGTTSVYDTLMTHPKIKVPRKKEIKYFSRRRNFYRWNFPISSIGEKKFITGEASTEYSFHTDVSELVRRYNPNMKIIVILRDPIERVISNYNDLIKYNKTEKSLSELITEGIELDLQRLTYQNFINNKKILKQTLLFRSRYDLTLPNWLVFKNLLICDFKQLRDDPIQFYIKIQKFLELPIKKLTIKKSNITEMPKQIEHTDYKKLINYFQPTYDFIKQLNVIPASQL